MHIQLDHDSASRTKKIMFISYRVFELPNTLIKFKKPRLHMRLLFKSTLLITYMQASVAFSIPKPFSQFRNATTKENAKMRECIGCDISILEGQPVKNLLTQSFSSNSRKHCTALSTSIRALLDLNNNVKNDAQNIKIMFQSPMEMLDMNGNGKIQKMDFKAIISVLMLSGVLLFNPVPAGALGLGGGGWYVPSGPADMRNDYPDYVRLHDRK